MPPIDNDAWPELLPAIRRQTLVIADRLNMTPATRDEFLGDAVAWIREKENLFDGTRGSLGAWCATVLRNRGVDLIRRHSAASAAREKYDQDTRAEQESRIRRARRDDEPDAPPAIDVIAVLERHVDADNRIFVAIDCRLLGEFDPQQVAGWIAEAGLPGFELVSWYGVFAPAGTPGDVVRRLNSEIVKAVASPELREQYAALGATQVSSTPEDFTAMLKRDIAKWGKVARDVKIEMQ